jgi:hypothetical protein
MKVVSLRRSGLLTSYYNKKFEKKIIFFFFVLGMLRFFYMVKTKQIDPIPFVSDLMRTEEGRMMVEQFLFCNYNNLF